MGVNLPAFAMTLSSFICSRPTLAFYAFGTYSLWVRRPNLGTSSSLSGASGESFSLDPRFQGASGVGGSVREPNLATASLLLYALTSRPSSPSRKLPPATIWTRWLLTKNVPILPRCAYSRTSLMLLDLAIVSVLWKLTCPAGEFWPYLLFPTVSGVSEKPSVPRNLRRLCA